MESIREPAVAGTFYPNDPVSLSSLIDTYLEATDQEGREPSDCPKAIIAPHAGYVYSGPIAGRAYQQISSSGSTIERVVLLGPSHRVAFKGMAVPTATSFRTPLGDIPIDSAAIAQIVEHPAVGFLDQAHAEEHSLEVHLPFLQQVIDSFSLVPIVVGDVSKEDVARVLETLWGGPETLIVISTDLSHYETYERASELDSKTCNKILALNPTLVGSEACGCRPVNGLLHYLKTHDLGIETIDIKNSGDTAGSKDRVVGYGAWKVTGATARKDEPEWSLAERQTLLQLARESIRSPLEGEKNFNINLDRFSSKMKQERATFVTLNINNQLRGCIGSLIAHRPLVVDVAHNSQAAAFKDPRFSPLTQEEYQRVDLHISILSQPQQIEVASRQELIEKLVPGKHGLIIKSLGKQATYLPSVWQQIKSPEQFVTELQRKAGLSPGSWSDDTVVMFYTTEEFS